MKVILTQCVEFENDKWPHHWTKEFETNLIPVIGMSIEDPMWKDPYTYKIIDVTLNFEENYYYVELEKYDPVIPSKSRADFEKVAKLHGWKLPGHNN